MSRGDTGIWDLFLSWPFTFSINVNRNQYQKYHQSIRNMTKIFLASKIGTLPILQDCPRYSPGVYARIQSMQDWIEATMDAHLWNATRTSKETAVFVLLTCSANLDAMILISVEHIKAFISQDSIGAVKNVVGCRLKGKGARERKNPEISQFFYQPPFFSLNFFKCFLAIFNLFLTLF